MLNLNLIIHNILSLVSIVLMLGLSLFTFMNGRKNVVNVTFSLLIFTAVIFNVSHLIGINVANSNLSRMILMFNLCMFIAGALQIHTVLAIIGKAHKQRWFIVFIYIVTISTMIFFVLNPDLFLHLSVPKMYFLNYYEPGSWNISRIFFLFIIIVPYSIFQLVRASRHSTDPQKKNQYIFIAATMAIAYAILFIPNFLVYDIQVDPIWGMLFAPIMLIPFLYGAIKYEMLNIKVIAKQAFLFALAVSVIGGIITLFNYSNIWMQQIIPSFPMWVSAFISSVLTVILSVVIWQRLRKNDMMRYEFITTVTHKFRTPLTHIKWSAENISNAQISPDIREQLGNIVSANAKLVELTDLLVKASEIERGDDIFHTEKMDLSYVVKGIVGSLSKQIQLKKLTTDKQITPNLLIIGVASKIQFVIQTLIENSISYTRNGGVITIITERRGNDALFSISDTGIGIPQNEQPLLFSKFYRATNARLEDTEGMGIGLFIAKEIVTRHRGKIWVESAGEGKGSTFSFSIPLMKK